MRFFTQGDKYGRNPSRYYCIASHLRPADYYFGIDCVERDVRVDNVVACMGTSIGTSDIRDIQLLVSKS